jgi:GNAT superfamily N-acetyltransferase
MGHHRVSAARALTTLEDLLDRTDRHPVVVLDVGSGFEPPAWAVDDGRGRAVVFPRRSDHGIPGAAALGDGPGLDDLFADARVREWFGAGGFRHLSVPRAHHAVVARHLELGERGGDWDWMWTTRSPRPVPGEESVRTVGAGAREELTAFLDEHSPRTHGQPFARPGQLWVAVRDDGGALLACGGSEPSAAGTPTLAGIAVHADRRRAGLGTAVTAHLTRRAVMATGACALGMFADNDAARRVYQRLGFTTGMRWRSRWLADAGPSSGSA